MTLNELLIVKAALWSSCTAEVSNQAHAIVEREIKLKELEHTLNTKKGNDASNSR